MSPAGERVAQTIMLALSVPAILGGLAFTISWIVGSITGDVNVGGLLLGLLLLAIGLSVAYAVLITWHRQRHPSPDPTPSDR